MKVSELEGALLDYWVAKALGLDPSEPDDCDRVYVSRGAESVWYSRSWEHGGPLIEREQMDIAYRPEAPCPHHELPRGENIYFVYSGPWHANLCIKISNAQSVNGVPGATMVPCFSIVDRRGDTPLIAAMRCFVASKFGEEVTE